MPNKFGSWFCRDNIPIPIVIIIIIIIIIIIWGEGVTQNEYVGGLPKKGGLDSLAKKRGWFDTPIHTLGITIIFSK